MSRPHGPQSQINWLNSLPILVDGASANHISEQSLKTACWASTSAGLNWTPSVMTETSSYKPDPVRTCVGCGIKDSQKRMVRLVAASSSTVVVDEQRRLPGRGAWLHPLVGCYERLRHSNRIAGALRLRGSGGSKTGFDWSDLDRFFATDGMDEPNSST